MARVRDPVRPGGLLRPKSSAAQLFGYSGNRKFLLIVTWIPSPGGASPHAGTVMMSRGLAYAVLFLARVGRLDGDRPQRMGFAYELALGTG